MLSPAFTWSEHQPELTDPVSIRIADPDCTVRSNRRTCPGFSGCPNQQNMNSIPVLGQHFQQLFQLHQAGWSKVSAGVHAPPSWCEAIHVDRFPADWWRICLADNWPCCNSRQPHRIPPAGDLSGCGQTWNRGLQHTKIERKQFKRFKTFFYLFTTVIEYLGATYRFVTRVLLQGS